MSTLLLAVKDSRGLVSRRNCEFLKFILPAHGLTQTHSLWAPPPGQQSIGHWWIQGGSEVSGIRVRARRQLVPVQNCRQWPLFLSWSLPHPQCGSTMYKTPSTWLTKFAPSRQLPKALPHWNYGPNQALNGGFSIWMSWLGEGFRPS